MPESGHVLDKNFSDSPFPADKNEFVPCPNVSDNILSILFASVRQISCLRTVRPKENNNGKLLSQIVKVI